MAVVFFFGTQSFYVRHNIFHHHLGLKMRKDSGLGQGFSRNKSNGGNIADGENVFILCSQGFTINRDPACFVANSESFITLGP